MEFNKFVTNIGKLNDVNPQLVTTLRKYVYPIIGACQEVHREMGPFLNEYMYQDALDIALEEAGYTGDDKVKEFYFTTMYHGKVIRHPHKVDFLVNKKVFIECKAVSALGADNRQQLWNYMRLAGVRIGVLYNFAPIIDQCERYYYDPDLKQILAF